MVLQKSPTGWSAHQRAGLVRPLAAICPHFNLGSTKVMAMQLLCPSLAQFPRWFVKWLDLVTPDEGSRGGQEEREQWRDWGVILALLLFWALLSLLPVAIHSNQCLVNTKTKEFNAWYIACCRWPLWAVDFRKFWLKGLSQLLAIYPHLLCRRPKQTRAAVLQSSCKGPCSQ